MLSRFRLATPLITQSGPQVSLRSFITAYDRMLLGMPKAMMMDQCFVRRHIVWKRALVASAAGHIKFNELTRGDLEFMSFDGACTQASLRLPSWLSLNTLASQVNCPVELLYMWASLWRAALVVGGSLSAMSKNSAGINCLLTRYLSHHSHSPSPHTLMLHHLRIPEGSEEDSDMPDAGGVSAKRRCPPRVGAEPSTEGPGEDPA